MSPSLHWWCLWCSSLRLVQKVGWSSLCLRGAICMHVCLFTRPLLESLHILPLLVCSTGPRYTKTNDPRVLFCLHLVPSSVTPCLLLLYSVSAAPYRCRSVVNLHHQDTETDEATMILPPADYSDTHQHNTFKNNTLSSSTIATYNNHQHSPTPSAASSSSFDHNTVSQ